MTILKYFWRYVLTEHIASVNQSVSCLGYMHPMCSQISAIDILENFER